MQVAEAALSQHPDIQPLLLGNVICAGGLAACPGFASRLELVLRPLIPDHIEVSLRCVLFPRLHQQCRPHQPQQVVHDAAEPAALSIVDLLGSVCHNRLV